MARRTQPAATAVIDTSRTRVRESGILRAYACLFDCTALLTLLLGFVSYRAVVVPRITPPSAARSPSLEYFRETLGRKDRPRNRKRVAGVLSHQASVASAYGSMFSMRAGAARSASNWQECLEAIGLSFLAMLLTTYFVPMFVYCRTKGAWMLRVLPLISLLAGAQCRSPRSCACSSPFWTSIKRGWRHRRPC